MAIDGNATGPSGVARNRIPLQVILQLCRHFKLKPCEWRIAQRKYLSLMKRDGKNCLAKSIFTGKLNPQWVEWLMGIPTDWTSIEKRESSN